MALALEKEAPERSVVAVLGDGAMTCGMSFEALNHAGDVRPSNLIIVLNDNEMSISPNVGAISRLFSMAVTSHVPTRARFKLKSLYKRGYIPELLYKIFDRAEEVTQGFISGPSMLFESLGIRYIGPVDGHNIKDLVRAFNQAKKQDVPVLIHAVTTKGKGYKPAEVNPTVWHGVNPFCKEKGEFIKLASKQTPIPSYTSVFSDTLIKIAHSMPEVVAITAAMPSGTGLDRFQREFPDRFYDVGICESHGVTFAAGLACEGKRPVCAIYSTFLQRAYDQILHDVCIQKLPVVFAIDRAGVVGDDGETHQGVFDISFLRSIPNMTIMAPKDENELQHMLFSAIKLAAPVAIRYPRGQARGVAMDSCPHQIPIGKGEVLRNGSDVLLIGLGNMVQYAEIAADLLANEGLSCGVINARFAKPLDEKLFISHLPRYKMVCTIEDQMLAGGFGSALVEFAADHAISLKMPIKRFGIGDHFVAHATQQEQHKMNHYDPSAIVHFILESFSSVSRSVVG
jgi:1-deoxy-D-xylulose-5-phosphate synthase